MGRGDRLIRVLARLVRHAGALTLRLPPGYELLAEILTRIPPSPHDVLIRPLSAPNPGPTLTQGALGRSGLPLPTPEVRVREGREAWAGELVEDDD